MSKKTNIKVSNERRMGIIGFGNIATAIVTGLTKKGFIIPSELVSLASNSVHDAGNKLKFGHTVCTSYEELCNLSDVILLAVKPQDINTVLPGLAKAYRGQLIISVITGIKIADYQRLLGKRARVIRTMPNMPVFLNLGATAGFANKNCSLADRKFCQDIFETLGIYVDLPKEDLLNAVTAISGSGPAFVYFYAKTVVDSAMHLGLKKDVAEALVLQTLMGATRMMELSGESFEDLINKVTSKAGTTFAGFKVLSKKGFAKTITACMEASAKRAKEMGKFFCR